MARKREMPKTLEDAIGCWTVNRDYNSLDRLTRLVLATASRCRKRTMKGDVPRLKSELELLRVQIGSLTELTDDAIRRLNQIIDTNELEQP